MNRFGLQEKFKIRCRLCGGDCEHKEPETCDREGDFHVHFRCVELRAIHHACLLDSLMNNTVSARQKREG